jgi:SAM-dependent methyltransferase
MTLSVDKALLENYANYYEQADDLAEWRRLGAVDKCSNIVRLCSRLEHHDVLEIGCGDGAILERLAGIGFGARFTGLEISPSAIQAVQRKKIPNLDVQGFEGYDLSFAEKRFDLAILSHVIEHVEYPRKLIREAARVAQNVFLEVPLEDNWRLSGDFVFDRVGHINFYNPKTIRRLVQSCGMNIFGASLSHGGMDCCVYRKGTARGTWTYLIKELGLRVWPNVASHAFTYNYSLTYRQSTR